MRYFLIRFHIRFDNLPWIDRNVRFLRFKKNISIGKNLVIKSNSILCSCNKNAIISIGDNVSIGYNNLIFASDNIKIGNNVLIAPNVHIVDSNHKSSLEKDIIFQENISKPIIIEDDVWIGSGCIILSGSHIKKGSIIAANSVVNSHLLSNSIYGGSPVKFIKKRK
tara:strand:+ start:1013 stop:1510 length:498 start_codon:yes stop_codon:yes gene_type:complete